MFRKDEEWVQAVYWNKLINFFRRPIIRSVLFKS